MVFRNLSSLPWWVYAAATAACVPALHAVAAWGEPRSRAIRLRRAERLAMVRARDPHRWPRRIGKLLDALTFTIGVTPALVLVAVLTALALGGLGDDGPRWSWAAPVAVMVATAAGLWWYVYDTRGEVGPNADRRLAKRWLIVSTASGSLLFVGPIVGGILSEFTNVPWGRWAAVIIAAVAANIGWSHYRQRP